MSQSSLDACLEGVYKQAWDIPHNYIDLDDIPIWDTIVTYIIFNDSYILNISINENIQESFLYEECYYISGESIHFYDYDPIQNNCGDKSQNYNYNSYLCSDNYVEFFKFNGVDLFERVEDVPLSLISFLYQKFRITNNNYPEKYLKKTIKSPCEPTLDVFNDIDGTKMGYLLKGDLLEVLVTEGEWAKVKFLKMDKIYWTYAGCLE